MGVGGYRHTPAALSLGMRLGTHCIGRWVGGPHGLSEWVHQILPILGFNLHIMQPVASRYTD
jgi:hypothetical protein